MQAHWHDLSGPGLATCAERDPVAVLVLGAIEQHGAHLPLSTDLDIGLGLQEAMLQALASRHATPDVLCLPALAVGASDEHISFSGTLSLPAPLVIATLEAYGDSLARAGIKRLMLLNSHGGNKAVMDIAALTLRRRHAMWVAKTTYTRLSPPVDLLPTNEWRHGLHGGAVETAMMLHLAPEKVAMQHAGNFAFSGESGAAQGGRLGLEGQASLAWLAEDLTPKGLAGNATLASAELGRRLVEHYAAALADVVVELASMRLPAR
ncbi:creatininase family protein [Halomonas sp. ZH2S]|uniref:Creatininase family protein n=1 Tax=Vreelandella zhuhanensis TaxID=2684210 RepID=A0A7X3KPQ3_9GAMM|nr:creatininase family protein [Halomonas zhuhanensis]MWJ27088.1 creatininase family protein [Halomonas zhuhanensis]